MLVNVSDLKPCTIVTATSRHERSRKYESDNISILLVIKFFHPCSDNFTKRQQKKYVNLSDSDLGRSWKSRAVLC